MSLYSEWLTEAKQKFYSPDYIAERLIAGRAYMDEHYSRKLDVNEVAAASFLSTFHFSRLFKRNYGRTPNEYLAAVRIANAKTLLQNGGLVSTVCSAVGFESNTTFCSLFRKMTGVTPGNYKRRYNPSVTSCP
jgi:AraC-like DNA-binding protein